MNQINTVHRDTREQVAILEGMMLAQPQVELKVKHHFSEGIYARELFIPKGTLLTGKIHKRPNLNIMSMGDMSVLVENEVKRVSAPFTVVSPPGTKRIAFAHEDSIWTTIHATTETDLSQIEMQFIAQSEAEYLEFCKVIEQERQKCLG